MDYFYVNGKLYLLVCDYFSKFSFVFHKKIISFANIRNHIQELLAIEGTPYPGVDPELLLNLPLIPDEIMSDNISPSAAKNLTALLQILVSNTSPHPQRNGFIETQVLTVKRLMEKAITTERSFQEALTTLQHSH